MTEDVLRVVRQIEQFRRVTSDDKSFKAFLSTIDNEEAKEEYFKSLETK